MRIEIRNDKVLLDGYVNAVGRDSREIITPHGKCVEQIMPGAFRRSLERNDDVVMLLNHKENRSLAETKDGTLELFEDSIGLRAIAEVTDPEVIQKAKNKELQGWSFGMYVLDDELEERAGKTPRRLVKELDMREVSLIDSRLSPCYTGTSVEQRAEGEVIKEMRGEEVRTVTVDETAVDYTVYENRLKALQK